MQHHAGVLVEIQRPVAVENTSIAAAQVISKRDDKMVFNACEAIRIQRKEQKYLGFYLLAFRRRGIPCSCRFLRASFNSLQLSRGWHVSSTGFRSYDLNNERI